MAIRVEWNELLPWMGTFGAAAVVTLVWLVRSRKEKREFAEAEACIERGQYAECLRHLGHADDNWHLNTASLTPKNMVRDIGRLIAITELIGTATAKLGSPANVDDLLAALKQWQAVFSDKKHFKFGSHTLKPEFAEQEQRLERRIGLLRTSFRSTYSRLIR